MRKRIILAASLLLFLNGCIAQPPAVPVPATTTPFAAETATTATPALDPAQFSVTEYELPAYPHDVAPDPEEMNTVWWTAQGAGALGRLNPTTGVR